MEYRRLGRTGLRASVLGVGGGYVMLLERVAGTALYRRAAALLRENLGGGPRVTRRVADGRSDLWVYRRRGLPCLRCGVRVEGADLGRIPRSTYWCPRCQGVETR